MMGGRAMDGMGQCHGYVGISGHVPNGWNWCMLLSFHLFLLFFHPSSPILLCAMTISAFIR